MTGRGRISLAAIVITLGAISPSRAQEPAVPGCAFDIKVASDRRVLVNCGRLWPAGQWRFQLWEYDQDWDQDPPARVRSSGVAQVADLKQVATLSFGAGALRGNREYRLVINRVEPASDPVVVSFTTAPEATLTLFDNRDQVAVRSAVALQPKPTCDPCTLVEVLTPKLLRRGKPPTAAEELSHPVTVTVSTVDDVAAIGTATLRFPAAGVSEGAARLRFAGLTNVFGDPVVAVGEIASIVPSSADEAEYALRLGFQTSRGNRAAYSIDGSAHPTIAARGLTAWRVLGEVDLGHNDRQSANSIVVGTEVLFPFRQMDAGPLFGWKPVARINYETDRHGDTANLVGVAETLLRLRNLYRPRKVVRQAEAVALSEELRRAIGASRVKTPDFGFIIPLVAGLDVGRSVRRPSSTAADNEDQAAITRLRAASGVTVEYKRLTITETVVGRWLLTDEREDAGAPELTGFKGYNELAFKIALDRLGHFGFGLTYKYGATPPRFQTTHALASSLVVIF